MELTILGVVIAGLAAALLYDWYAQQSHVKMVLDRWESGGKTVQVQPIGLICHGDRPCARDGERIYGAIGVANGDFVFLGQRISVCDLSVSTDAIRWIGVRTETTHHWNRTLETQTLIVHLETPHGWNVYTFTQGKPGRLMDRVAESLAAHASLTVHDMGEVFEDYGPAPAVPLALNAQGEWQTSGPQALDLDRLPPEWDGKQQTLYLAPDRLLFDWRDPIMLADIQQVSVEPRETANTLRASDYDLLRIDYRTPDGQMAVRGFLVEGAQDWANEINAQCVDCAAETGMDAPASR